MVLGRPLFSPCKISLIAQMLDHVMGEIWFQFIDMLIKKVFQTKRAIIIKPKIKNGISNENLLFYLCKLKNVCVFK